MQDRLTRVPARLENLVPGVLDQVGRRSSAGCDLHGGRCSRLGSVHDHPPPSAVGHPAATRLAGDPRAISPDAGGHVLCSRPRGERGPAGAVPRSTAATPGTVRASTATTPCSVASSKSPAIRATPPSTVAVQRRCPPAYRQITADLTAKRHGANAPAPEEPLMSLIGCGDGRAWRGSTSHFTDLVFLDVHHISSIRARRATTAG